MNHGLRNLRSRVLRKIRNNRRYMAMVSDVHALGSEHMDLENMIYMI